MEDNSDERLYNNLLILIKLFKNRPNHLTRYLLENDALNKAFIKKIMDSKKINEIYKKNGGNIVDDISINTYLLDISHMNDYFSSINEMLSNINEKTIEEITYEVNEKLDSFLLNEKYEDAIDLRDYMTKNNIKRIVKK